MALENVAIYAICVASSIAPGEAKAFSLLRKNEAGEGRPFSIVVVRKNAKEYFGYVNACPHKGVWLNIGAGTFFDACKKFLQCGRHGAKFEIDTGHCVEGPCEGVALESVALAVVQGDVCICGVELIEEDGIPDPFAVENDDTMEIMIHPD
jgi:nitrite reductase/ring-hydroxylating ferredoxin subunit